MFRITALEELGRKVVGVSTIGWLVVVDFPRRRHNDARSVFETKFVVCEVCVFGQHIRRDRGE